jgi:hypothetical protein
MNGSSAPRNQNMSTRSAMITRQYLNTQSSNVAAAQDMSFTDIPNNVRELISDFPPEVPVDSSGPQGSNNVMMNEISREMGVVEPQPMFYEIEKRFEQEFANLHLIEDVNVWQGYTSADDTWEPWHRLEKNTFLHTILTS